MNDIRTRNAKRKAAIRENMRRKEYRAELKAPGPSGNKMAALMGHQHAYPFDLRSGVFTASSVILGA